MKRTWVLVALFVYLSWAAASAEPPANKQGADVSSRLEEVLARLEERMSAVQSLKANFVQEKHLAILDQPLVLRGSIFMQKPDLFAWHVREPLRYSMVIEGEAVSQWDEDTGQVQKISLSESPPFRVAIRQLRDWFSGSYRPMRGEYEIAVLDEDPISITFVPRPSTFAQEFIERITIIFEGDERYLRQIRIVERRGDSTLLSFADTALNTVIDPSAWKVGQRVR